MFSCAFTPTQGNTLDITIHITGDGFKSQHIELGNPKKFGFLQGDDYDYGVNAFLTFMKEHLDCMRYRGAAIRPFESISASIDPMTKVASVFFRIPDGQVCYVYGDTLNYREGRD